MHNNARRCNIECKWERREKKVETRDEGQGTREERGESLNNFSYPTPTRSTVRSMTGARHYRAVLPGSAHEIVRDCVGTCGNVRGMCGTELTDGIDTDIKHVGA